MNCWLYFFSLTASVCLISSASVQRPHDVASQTFIGNRNIYKVPGGQPSKEYPRKGEACKDGVCKPVRGKPDNCEDCQYALPLEEGDWDFNN